MDNLNDLKAVWRSVRTDNLPNATKIVRVVKKYRARKLFKTTAVVLAACMLLTALIIVVFAYKSALLSTRIGEALLIAAAAVLVAANISSLNRYARLKQCSNVEFLLFLQQTRVRRHFYYQKTQVVGMGLCSAGLLLYLYEGVYKNTALCIMAYGLMVLYLLVLWFVIRPRVFKKQGNKLNEKIERLKNISNQF